jgi:predicted nucleic acid-binding protein
VYLVDSCGWLEYFSNGKKAEKYERYLLKPDLIIVPSIVLYEVYKKVKSGMDEDCAILAVAQMENSKKIPFNDDLALLAADISLLHGLHMADSIIYASAISNKAILVTSDEHFKGLEKVELV